MCAWAQQAPSYPRSWNFLASGHSFDVQTAIDVAKFIAGEGRRAEGETIPSALNNKFCMTIRQPLGVVGIITPWNFPLAIPAWKTFPALLAGNAVILKPASDTPLLSLKMAQILHEAGLPAGVLNVITGPGGVLGDALASHKGVNMISLTGSTEVGRLSPRFADATCAAAHLNWAAKMP